MEQGSLRLFDHSIPGCGDGVPEGMAFNRRGRDVQFDGVVKQRPVQVLTAEGAAADALAGQNSLTAGTRMSASRSARYIRFPPDQDAKQGTVQPFQENDLEQNCTPLRGVQFCCFMIGDTGVYWKYHAGF